MEFKAIAYIIIGIIYAVYSIKKKVDEQKNAPRPPVQSPPTSTAQPNPNAKSIDEILREMQRTLEQTKKPTPPPTPKPASKPKPQPKKQELLVKEKKRETVFEEGSTVFGNTYERDLTLEEKIHAKSFLATNTEGIGDYVEQEEYTNNFDARQAFIGSIIFERKF
jgi:type IV secretory pathway VirB10-like protein